MHLLCMCASNSSINLAGVDFLRSYSLSLIALVALKYALHLWWPECAILSHSLRLQPLAHNIPLAGSAALRCAEPGRSRQHAAYEGLVGSLALSLLLLDLGMLAAGSVIDLCVERLKVTCGGSGVIGRWGDDAVAAPSELLSR